MRDFSGDHRALSINTATVRKQGDLVAIVEACARAQIPAISPWRDQVAHVGLDRAVAAVKDAGLTLSGYCRGGMFPADPAHMEEARDDNRRAVDEAAALGAPCLVLVVGGPAAILAAGICSVARISRGARRMVEDGIGALLEYAHRRGYAARDRAAASDVRRRPCVREHDASGARHLRSRRSAAVRHARRCGRRLSRLVGPGTVSPRSSATGRDRLLAYHVCDWLVPTKDLLLDRGMMGDGVIDLRAIRAKVESVGYGGYCEVEIFSEHWWSKPMDEVLATCIERHRNVV